MRMACWAAALLLMTMLARDAGTNSKTYHAATVPHKADDEAAPTPKPTPTLVAAALQLASAPAPAPPASAACPVVAGVVNADKCHGGYNRTDSTAALQAALNAPGAHTVIISNGSRTTPWITGPLKIQACTSSDCHPQQDASNRTVWLGPGVVIQAIRGGFKGLHDSLLWILGVKNVSIRVGDPFAGAHSDSSPSRSPLRVSQPQPAELRMWKEDYWAYPAGNPTPDCVDQKTQQCSYNRSEWRMGIQIGTEWVPPGHPGSWGPAPCEDIVVSGGEHGLRITRTGGDGIIVTACNRTHIQNVQAIENHRQGLSIINAQDMVVEDCEFSRTNGTGPAAGIDIEPDFAQYSLVNITLRRLLLEENDGHGFQLVLREWARRPTEVLAPISLTLEDVVARGSFSPTSVSHGFQLTMVEDDKLNQQGSIVLSNCIAEGTNLAGLQLGDVTVNSARVTIVDMQIINAAQSDMGAQYTNDPNAPVDLGWLGWDLAANNTEPPCGFDRPQSCGGVTLTNLKVVDNANRPWLQLASAHYNGTGNLRGSVTVTNPHGCMVNSTAGPLDPLPNLLTSCEK